jgi:hypothetical protein
MRCNNSPTSPNPSRPQPGRPYIQTRLNDQTQLWFAFVFQLLDIHHGFHNLWIFRILAYYWIRDCLCPSAVNFYDYKLTLAMIASYQNEFLEDRNNFYSELVIRVRSRRHVQFCIRINLWNDRELKPKSISMQIVQGIVQRFVPRIRHVYV